MLDVIPYMPFAINFHWTPKQVDLEIPATMRPYWNDVYAVFVEQRADAQKKAIEDAKRN